MISKTAFVSGDLLQPGISEAEYFPMGVEHNSRYGHSQTEVWVSCAFIITLSLMITKHCNHSHRHQNHNELDQVNNANSAIIFMIDPWSVKVVRVVRMVRGVQVTVTQLKWLTFREGHIYNHWDFFHNSILEKQSKEFGKRSRVILKYAKCVPIGKVPLDAAGWESMN